MPRGSRRRTPGLRREEVALLAGVGVTWYTWLEQGRQINASTQVLDAVAGTLRLDRAERDGCTALVMSAARTRTRSPGKAFQRMGFRSVKGRELSPMPGLTLDVFLLALPRGPSAGGAAPGRWRRSMS